MQTIKTFPVPWTLNGYGYIVLFKARPEWLQANAFISEDLKDKYIPSVGAAMFVNYLDSTAGPYGELLFIPGKFKFPDGTRYSISKIYVSSMESVVNGQNNWGIPKELADFDFAVQDDGSERIRINLAGELIADCRFSSRRPGIPVTTSILPKKFRTVAQQWKGEVFYTSPQARSKLKLARLQDARFNADLVPDLNQVKVLAVTKADEMVMQFPEALVSPIGAGYF